MQNKKIPHKQQAAEVNRDVSTDINENSGKYLHLGKTQIFVLKIDLSGYVWFCLVVSGFVWWCLVVSGRVWSCLVVSCRVRSVLKG